MWCQNPKFGDMRERHVTLAKIQPYKNEPFVNPFVHNGGIHLKSPNFPSSLLASPIMSAFSVPHYSNKYGH